MAVMQPFGGQDDDIPEVQCSECDVIFSVIWRRDGITDRVEYCPFCGSEFGDDE